MDLPAVAYKLGTLRKETEGSIFPYARQLMCSTVLPQKRGSTFTAGKSVQKRRAYRLWCFLNSILMAIYHVSKHTSCLSGKLSVALNMWLMTGWERSVPGMVAAAQVSAPSDSRMTQSTPLHKLSSFHILQHSPHLPRFLLRYPPSLVAAALC